jgi:hypothetical protein
LKGIRPLYACIKLTLKKMQSMLLTIIQKWRSGNERGNQTHWGMYYLSHSW